MKKFTILFVTLLFTFSTFGQWSAGARLGANFSTITGKYSEHDENKSGWITGMAFGAVGNYEFTEMISLNAELLYITIGDKTKYNETGEKSSLSSYDYVITERYNYLQLPILARFTFGSSIIFYGIIGPYMGYKIGGKYKAEYDGQVTEGKLRFKEKNLEENDWLYNSDVSRRFDFGIYVGGGAGKKIGPGVLEVDVRLGIGLLDHNKFESKDAKKTAKDNGYKSNRTMNICLTVAYMYPFGKDTPKRFID